MLNYFFFPHIWIQMMVKSMYSENVIYLFKTFYIWVFHTSYVKCGFKASEHPDLQFPRHFVVRLVHEFIKLRIIDLLKIMV